MIAWLEKQGEQKPADKVEPKFKVEKDKWYVCTSQYCNCIEGRNYKASLDGRIIDDYGTEYDMHNDAYRWFRPWTIQDAKDGDVLVIESGRITLECLFIFKGIANREVLEHCYYRINDNTFSPTGSFIGYLDNVYHPATKEQSNLLFQKMKEAGYEWDAEKKELNKIESFGKYEGLTDFERTLADVCIGWIGEENGWKQYIKDNADILLGIAVKMFNSVQDAPFEQKPTWSEEDEDVINHLLAICAGAKKYRQFAGCLQEDITKCQTWLQSRVQPQTTWKPSDEQIDALEDAIADAVSSIQKYSLESLYNELKKL